LIGGIAEQHERGVDLLARGIHPTACHFQFRLRARQIGEEIAIRPFVHAPLAPRLIETRAGRVQPAFEQIRATELMSRERFSCGGREPSSRFTRSTEAIRDGRMSYSELRRRRFTQRLEVLQRVRARLLCVSRLAELHEKRGASGFQRHAFDGRVSHRFDRALVEGDRVLEAATDVGGLRFGAQALQGHRFPR
jgi:hypothetical protein